MGKRARSRNTPPQPTKGKGAPGSSGAPAFAKGGKGKIGTSGKGNGSPFTGWSRGEGAWRHSPHDKEHLLQLFCGMTPQLLDEALRQGLLANFKQCVNAERNLGLHAVEGGRRRSSTSR